MSFKIIDILVGVQQYLTVVLVCVSLKTDAVEHLFMCLWAIPGALCMSVGDAHGIYMSVCHGWGGGEGGPQAPQLYLFYLNFHAATKEIVLKCSFGDHFPDKTLLCQRIRSGFLPIMILSHFNPASSVRVFILPCPNNTTIQASRPVTLLWM